MPRGDRTGPLGEGPFTGRRGGIFSPRMRFGPGWRASIPGGSGGMGQFGGRCFGNTGNFGNSVPVVRNRIRFTRLI